jgi:hypothetical protein
MMFCVNMLWKMICKDLEIPARQATSLTHLLLEMPICVYVGVFAGNGTWLYKVLNSNIALVSY